MISLLHRVSHLSYLRQKRLCLVLLYRRCDPSTRVWVIISRVVPLAFQPGPHLAPRTFTLPMELCPPLLTPHFLPVRRRAILRSRAILRMLVITRPSRTVLAGLGLFRHLPVYMLWKMNLDNVAESGLAVAAGSSFGGRFLVCRMTTLIWCWWSLSDSSRSRMNYGSCCMCYVPSLPLP